VADAAAAAALGGACQILLATSYTRILNPYVLSCSAFMMWRAMSAKPIARHAIDTHVEPSFIFLNGISYEGASNILQAHCPPCHRQALWSLVH
jgi:hypothetical protein